MKIQEKLNEIYRDLESNVTSIWERQDLHLLYDLAYHSILQFEFMGQLLTRGWVEVLAIGDTRCGKTRTAERMLRHYCAGEMGTGENTSLAGLIGGMQQINRQWSIVWGKFPRNDRRLVVVDEASTLPVEAIPSFATIRSEGVARITKIQAEETYSRTRAIWISNPRIGRDGISRPIAAYDYGILTVPELIGRQADVARFDAIIVVANGEVSSDVIFRTDRQGVHHKVSSRLSNSLIMWAWSRRPEHVVCLKETEAEIINQAKQLARKYHESIPLLKLEELPEKLARLSAALAARLFSTTDGANLVVYPDHVSYISSFLDRIYSKPVIGYDSYSQKLFDVESINDEDLVLEKISPFGMDFVKGILMYPILRQNVIEDLTGLDRDRVKALISMLVRNRCLRPDQLWYRKTEPFIKMLKRVEAGRTKLTHTEEF
jgi:hypothetical protein